MPWPELPAGVLDAEVRRGAHHFDPHRRMDRGHAGQILRRAVERADVDEDQLIRRPRVLQRCSAPGAWCIPACRSTGPGSTPTAPPRNGQFAMIADTVPLFLVIYDLSAIGFLAGVNRKNEEARKAGIDHLISSCVPAFLIAFLRPFFRRPHRLLFPLGVYLLTRLMSSKYSC